MPSRPARVGSVTARARACDVLRRECAKDTDGAPSVDVLLQRRESRLRSVLPRVLRLQSEQVFVRFNAPEWNETTTGTDRW